MCTEDWIEHGRALECYTPDFCLLLVGYVECAVPNRQSSIDLESEGNDHGAPPRDPPNPSIKKGSTASCFAPFLWFRCGQPVRTDEDIKRENNARLWFDVLTRLSIEQDKVMNLLR